MAFVDICVCCGAVIPEGSLVFPKCMVHVKQPPTNAQECLDDLVKFFLGSVIYGDSVSINQANLISVAEIKQRFRGAKNEKKRR